LLRQPLQEWRWSLKLTAEVVSIILCLMLLGLLLSDGSRIRPPVQSVETSRRIVR
jgi:hypothetical protein